MIHEVTPTGVTERTVDPEDLGLARAETAELAGGSADENATLVVRVLSGDLGPRGDVVVLNAAAAFVVAGRAETLEAGIDLARHTIASGGPIDLLERLRAERREHDAAVDDTAESVAIAQPAAAGGAAG